MSYLLFIGLALWVVAHLFPAVAAGARARLIERIGMAAYMGGFSALILLALALIVLGWRASEVSWLYHPPAWGWPLAMLLMLLSVILFFAGRLQSNIRRVIRHPQLTAVKTWALAHLLANGETRSVVLFTTLGLWAVLEVIVINKRIGTKIKPDPMPKIRDLLTVLAGLIAYVVLAWGHTYFAGVGLIN